MEVLSYNYIPSFNSSSGHRYGKSYYAKKSGKDAESLAPFFKADVVLSIPNVVRITRSNCLVLLEN